MTTNFKVACPIEGNPYDNEGYFPEYNRVISEIVNFSEKIAFIDIEGVKFRPKIYKDSREFTKSWRVTGIHPCLILEVDIPDRHDTTEGEKNVMRYKNVFRVLYQSYYFMAMCQLAYPDSIGSEVLEIYFNDQRYFQGLDMGNYIYNPSWHFERGWPKFRRVSVLEIYNWLEKKNIDFKKFSSTPAHRALIAFVNLASSNHYSIEHHMMWSMNGIEALYNTSSDSIVRQINERTQLILGQLSGPNNTVKKLYNWRSQFSHGKLNLLMLYGEANREETKQNKFYNEVSDQIKLAIHILTASVQELVLQDKTEFKFPPIMNLRQSVISKLKHLFEHRFF